MAVVSIHISVAWLIITALVTWNMHQILPFALTFSTFTFLVMVQTLALHGFARFALGPLGVADFDALFTDTNLLSSALWFGVVSTHLSGLEFATRHLILLGLQRLLRLPSVRLSLWTSLSPFQKARAAAFTVAVWGSAVLACAYWATDPYPHDTHSLLLAEGICTLVSATTEVGIFVWTWLSVDVLQRPQPDPQDTPSLALAFGESVVHLLLALYVTAQDRVVSIGPPIPIQIMMLKRIWLLGSSYSKYCRSLSVLEHIPKVSGDQLTEATATCSICLDGIKEGRQLPCGHCFHSACLRRWLMASASCPLCRRRYFDLSSGSAVAVDASEDDSGVADARRTASPTAPTPLAGAASAAPAAGRRRRNPPAPPAAFADLGRRRDADAEDERLGEQQDQDANGGVAAAAEDDVRFRAPDPWPFHRMRRRGPGAEGGAVALLDQIFGSPVRPPPELLRFPSEPRRSNAPSPDRQSEHQPSSATANRPRLEHSRQFSGSSSTSLRASAEDRVWIQQSLSQADLTAIATPVLHHLRRSTNNNHAEPTAVPSSSGSGGWSSRIVAPRILSTLELDDLRDRVLERIGSSRRTLRRQRHVETQVDDAELSSAAASPPGGVGAALYTPPVALEQSDASAAAGPSPDGDGEPPAAATLGSPCLPPSGEGSMLTFSAAAPQLKRTRAEPVSPPAQADEGR